MATKTKTGQKAPISGQYKPVGSKTEVTLIKNHWKALRLKSQN